MIQFLRIFSRFIRSASFLASIFTCSFVYFIIKSGFLIWIIRNYISRIDAEEQLLDNYKLTAHRHIQWLADRTPSADFNDTSRASEEITCRNTRQGRTAVTDDRGYTCDRAHLMVNGCCEVSSKMVRFGCNGCDRTAGCCSFYEECVACCMKPEQKNVLLEMIQSTSGHRLRQILAATDQFELCMLKCRTSSNSVHSENKYKSEKLKYCYKQEPPRPFK